MSFDENCIIFSNNDFYMPVKHIRKKRSPSIYWTTEMHMDFLNGIVQCIKNGEKYTATNILRYMETKMERVKLQSHLQKWKASGGILTMIDKGMYDDYKKKIDEVESSRESSRSSSPIIFETELELGTVLSTDCLTSFMCEIPFLPSVLENNFDPDRSEIFNHI